MSKSDFLSIKVNVRSHLSRIVFGLRLHILIIIGIILYSAYKFDWESILLPGLIIALVGIGIPLLLGYRFYRFYIVELIQNDNVLNVKIMDNDQINNYVLDLHKIKLVLSRLPGRQAQYSLDFYEEGKKIFYQVPMFDWDRDKLEEIYEKLKGYYTGA